MSGAVFVGVDLAADPARTGLAALRESTAGVVVERVVVGVEDDAIIDAVADADRVGVDVPIGWPDSFVELVRRHAAGELAAPESTGPDWRREHVLRATDRWVHEQFGLTPLSVAADRIAHPALRWAGIEARLREHGSDLTRDGTGVVVEAYPAGALASWGLAHRGYKAAKNLARRTELVGALAELLPWLDWNGHREPCVADDNALDAVLAALIAREVARGNHHRAPESLQDKASREGWICIPVGVPTAR
ncbi:hypothetical protein CGZ94_11820 [Enemella evansiae]|uniref:DUF429 domain-containing protein n=1 Tax=Enemella evansiae TaxID=2016499 RepID=A0A255GCM1_9ACTN|nr:DUF429 domain-containing protein [Enemella evansiae]OYO13639.1 hypothetical protein CGZ94_11820 [Enemella evansiae]